MPSNGNFMEFVFPCMSEFCMRPDDSIDCTCEEYDCDCGLLWCPIACGIDIVHISTCCCCCYCCELCGAKFHFGSQLSRDR